MSKSKTFHILVDEEPLTFHGSESSFEQDEIGTRIADVNSDIINKNLSQMLQNIDESFSNDNLQLENFNVDEINLDLHIDASGNVSILGVLKAGINTKTTLSVKLVKKV